MAALELLDALKSSGISLRLDGSNVVVQGRLTDDIRHQIRQHKQDLVELMKDGEHKWEPI